MSWFAVGAAGVGLVSTFMGNKSRKKGYDQQAAIEQDRLALDQERLDWGKEQYSDWKSKFDPMYQSAVDEMDQDLTPNYGAIAGDVKSSFESARGANERNLMRYGIRPTDGSMQAMNRDYGIREAASHVGNRAVAREGARGVLWDRKAKVTGMLAPMQSGPMSNVRAGYNAMGDTQDQRGRNAAAAGRRQGDFYRGLGQDIGGIAGGIDWKGIAGSVRSRGQNSSDWGSINSGTYPSGPPT